jgi:hypothetical protein
MQGKWKAIRNTVFWSHDRGTWPYDVAVILVVAFVFLSPRNWFSDQPLLGPAPQAAQVQLVKDDPGSPARVYRIDALLLSIPKRTPELEKETHDVLRKNVEELRKRKFQIERIDPVRGEDGTILYYDVVVKK